MDFHKRKETSSSKSSHSGTYLYKSVDGSTLLLTHDGSYFFGTAEITNQGTFRIETIERYNNNNVDQNQEAVFIATKANVNSLLYLLISSSSFHFLNIKSIRCPKKSLISEAKKHFTFYLKANEFSILKSNLV